MSSDLGEKIAAERTLEDSVEHFRQAVRLAPSIPWAATPDGTVDYMGSTYEWSPMSTSAERHEQWRARMDEADQVRGRAEWLAHMRSKTLFRTEFRILWPDNTWKWVRSQAFPCFDERGEVVRWFSVMADVSAEHRLAERVAELEFPSGATATDQRAARGPEGRYVRRRAGPVDADSAADRRPRPDGG